MCQKIKIYKTDEEMTMAQLLECVTEAAETGEFYIDAIEEKILALEYENEQLKNQVAMLMETLEEIRR